MELGISLHIALRQEEIYNVYIEQKTNAIMFHLCVHWEYQVLIAKAVARVCSQYLVNNNVVVMMTVNTAVV